MTEKEDGGPDVRIVSERPLSDGIYSLRSYVIDRRRLDGRRETRTREIFDRGDGAAILLYDPARATVILVRQFRMPAYLKGVDDGMLIEVPAGTVEEDDPAATMVREVEEETGYHIAQPEPLCSLFMTPGAVTERVHFFVAPIDAAHRPAPGGGVAEEGEDIEVLEVPFAEALAMVGDGRIRDAKTALLLMHARLAGLMEA